MANLLAGSQIPFANPLAEGDAEKRLSVGSEGKGGDIGIRSPECVDQFATGASPDTDDSFLLACGHALAVGAEGGAPDDRFVTGEVLYRGAALGPLPQSDRPLVVT